MALTVCPECRRDCSDQADSCPHCGFPTTLGRTTRVAAARRIEGVDQSSVVSAIAPSGIQISFGIALIVLSAWLMMSWLPAHSPMTVAGAAAYVADGLRNFEDRSDHFVIKESWYPWLYVITAALGCLGVVQVVRGATFRRFRETYCRRCKVMVRAVRTFVRGPRCPNGGHSTTSTAVTSILVATFGIVWALVAAAYMVKVSS
jgi:hypothetical protein